MGIQCQDPGQDLDSTGINSLDMLAVLLALRRFWPLIQGKHMSVCMDNTVTMAYKLPRWFTHVTTPPLVLAASEVTVGPLIT